MSGHVCKWGECNQGFESIDELALHLGSVHVCKNIQAFCCEWEECDHAKQFPNRFALMTHLRKHTGEKPYKCLICGKGFSRNDALAKHAKTHEESAPAGNPDVVASKPSLTSEEIRYSLLKDHNDLLKLRLHSDHAKIRRLRAEKLVILDKLLEDSSLKASII